MATNVKRKVEELYNELCAGKGLVLSIISTLEDCDDQTNFTERIGCFARSMPEFKILAAQRENFVSLVRKICTGEVSLEKALELLREAEKQLNEALNCIVI